MKPDLENEKVSRAMLEKILDTVDFPIFTFDKDRKILFSNKAHKEALEAATPGSRIGAAEPGHFSQNQYYDTDGNLLDYPNGSAIEKALALESTVNLLLEHRNKKARTHKWICISCEPVKDSAGNFEYGVMWYQDFSIRKSREDKLRFLLQSTRILSLTMEFEKRLQEKAKLFVPSLADWVKVEIVDEDGTLKRIALVHRDPLKLEAIRIYEEKYPPNPDIETSTQRVARTDKAEFTPVITEEMIENITALSDDQKKEIKALDLSSLITVPVSIGGKVLGVLTLAYAESGRVYTDEDLEFVTEFANHLGVLLENARLYDEISRRDLSKDAFLTTLSHELRNPLAPIRTSLELLRMKNPDITFREEIDTISHQFGHMTRLLNDLLDSTRFIRGKINVALESTEFIRIVEQVVKAMRPLFEESSIRLSLSYPSKQLYLMADRTRLEQALTNILNNAIKFTPRGGSISIDIMEKSDSIIVKIKDSGIGIAEEELKHIFDPYYQGMLNKPEHSGLGIGLFLVDQIITQHNGRIEAASEGEHRGTEFTITLPLAAPEYKPKTNASMPTSGESKIRRILVVDDNEAAADALVRLLNALGFKSAAVYSGKSALEFLETKSVDLIFLDIGMPEMSGYELVRMLKEHESFQNIPIVAVTGYGLEDDKIKAIQAGFNAHITKPIGARDLREILTGDLGA